MGVCGRQVRAIDARLEGVLDQDSGQVDAVSIAGPAVIVTGGQCCFSCRRRPGGLASSAEVELKGAPGIFGTGSDRLLGSWLGSRAGGPV